MTSIVGDYPANPLGLCDMSGNVWEWCADRMRRYDGTPTVDPREEDQALKPVVRGGAWINSERSLRSAARGSGAIHIKCHTFGFRCARVVKVAGVQIGTAKKKSGVWTIESGRRR